MIKRTGAFLAVILAGLAIASCGGKTGLPEMVAEVNNEYVTTDEFVHHFRMRGGFELQGSARARMRKWLIAELVDRKLLLQEARARRIRPERSDVRADFAEKGRKAWGEREKEQFMQSEDDIYEQKKIEILLKANFMVPGVRAAEIDAYIKRHPGEFIRPAQARICWVMVNSASKVKKAGEQLVNGMPIGEVAKGLSDEPVSMRGAWSWRDESQMPREVWEAASRAPLKKSVGPVPTGFGTFYIEVRDRRKESAMSREESREAARRRIVSMKNREAVENYLASLRASAKIRVDFNALGRL